MCDSSPDTLSHENKKLPPRGFLQPAPPCRIAPLPHRRDAHSVRLRVAQQPDAKSQTTSSFRWLTRLASTLGIQSERSAERGGAIKLDKDPAEQQRRNRRLLFRIAVRHAICARSRQFAAGSCGTSRRSIRRRFRRLLIRNRLNPSIRRKVAALRDRFRRRREIASSAPTPTGLNFDGVGVGLAGFSPSSNPPDVNGRVGATQYVQWNNTSFAVFNKTTGALEYGPAAGNTLFQALGGVCASHNDGDPVVSYDILAGRWVISQFVVAASQTSYSHQCFAVSTTSDATGEYYLYDFVTDPVNFVDYPHTGVWPDGYYMSAHVFGAGLVFTTGRIYVFEREKMIHGLPARMQSADLGLEYGFLPADLDSLTPPPAGAAEFLLGPNFGLTNLTDSYRVAVTWDPAPTIVTTRTEIQGGIGNAPCLSGATTTVATACRSLHQRLQRTSSTTFQGTTCIAWLTVTTARKPRRRNGSLSVVRASGSDANHGAVEWFEFRNAGSSTTHPTLFQSGTFDPDTSYRWLPSIAMDKDGNIALGYSKSSPTVNPGIYITGRLASDPVGTMGAEAQVQAGIGRAARRWESLGRLQRHDARPDRPMHLLLYERVLKDQTGASTGLPGSPASSFHPASRPRVCGAPSPAQLLRLETDAPIPGVTVSFKQWLRGRGQPKRRLHNPCPGWQLHRHCRGRRIATAPRRRLLRLTVAPPGGGTVTQNFAMTGTSKLEANGFTIDDSLGNNNGIVNRAECVNLNLGVKNNGCATETAISATLTTTTPGVTVVDGNSTYPDMPIDASGTNATPFKISVANTFVCGTEIALSLNLTYASGSKSISVHRPDLCRRSGSTDPDSASSRRVIRRRPIGLAGTAARAPAPARRARAAVSPERTITRRTHFTNTSGARSLLHRDDQRRTQRSGRHRKRRLRPGIRPDHARHELPWRHWYQRPGDYRRSRVLLVHRSRGA